MEPSTDNALIRVPRRRLVLLEEEGARQWRNLRIQPGSWQDEASKGVVNLSNRCNNYLLFLTPNSWIIDPDRVRGQDLSHYDKKRGNLS